MAGFVSALGIGVGCLTHVVAVSLGLTALLHAVPVAFEIMRWIGAIYLVYLGIKLLSGNKKLDSNSAPEAHLCGRSLDRVCSLICSTRR